MDLDLFHERWLSDAIIPRIIIHYIINFAYSSFLEHRPLLPVDN